RLGVAQADLVQAGLLANPTLSGAVGINLGAGDNGYSFGIVQNFIDLFLIPLRRRLADAEFRRVKLEVADDVLELAGQVRAACYAVLAAQQSVALRRTFFEAAQVSAELAAQQHLAGN